MLNTDPRLTSADTCTIVITMVKVFPKGFLPNQPTGLIGSIGFSDFDQIGGVADNVWDSCVYPPRASRTGPESPGYEAFGKARRICVLEYG